MKKQQTEIINNQVEDLKQKMKERKSSLVRITSLESLNLSLPLQEEQITNESNNEKKKEEKKQVINELDVSKIGQISSLDEWNSPRPKGIYREEEITDITKTIELRETITLRDFSITEQLPISRPTEVLIEPLEKIGYQFQDIPVYDPANDGEKKRKKIIHERHSCIELNQEDEELEKELNEEERSRKRKKEIDELKLFASKRRINK